MTPDQAVEKVVRFQPKQGDVFVVAVADDVHWDEMADLAERVKAIVEPTGATACVLRANEIQAFVSCQSVLEYGEQELAT